MTELLFLEDSYLTSCTAQVIDCQPSKKKGPVGQDLWEVQLTRTVLFPEGGGQLPDHGTIGDAKVLDVQEKGEQVLHYCNKPLEVGSCQEVCLDTARRLEMMQQHTGEHLVSIAAFKLFGANNVGFHMNERLLTVDLDKHLTQEEVDQLEDAANAYVVEDHKISAQIIDLETYETVPMRKKAQGLTGDIRMVTMEGLDAATCCGTHVSTTAQVGQVKILSVQNYKGGVRLEVVCGVRALSDYRLKNNIVNDLAVHFSAQVPEVRERIARLEEENLALRQTVKEKTAALLKLRAEALKQQAKTQSDGVRLIVATSDDLDSKELKILAEILTVEENTVAIAVGSWQNRLYYCVGASRGGTQGARQWCSKLSELLEGKGGGSEAMAQGSAPFSQDWKERLNDLV